MNVAGMSGTELQERFEGCMQLARQALERARSGRTKPTVAQVYTPTSSMNGHWGFKTAKVWASPGGKYLVGYDLQDPNHAARIYRKKVTSQPAGGALNPTYQVYATSVWQDSEMGRLETALRAMG
tara:strand:+ start:3351 stop:3725 length:375 start_codon:yes stop_codon:yes gene_type:complete